MGRGSALTKPRATTGQDSWLRGPPLSVQAVTELSLAFTDEEMWSKNRKRLARDWPAAQWQRQNCMKPAPDAHVPLYQLNDSHRPQGISSRSACAWKVWSGCRCPWCSRLPLHRDLHRHISGPSGSLSEAWQAWASLPSRQHAAAPFSWSQVHFLYFLAAGRIIWHLFTRICIFHLLSPHITHNSVNP